MQPILDMRDITKTFPGVNALSHVNLTVMPGEIHAVVGENVMIMDAHNCMVHAPDHKLVLLQGANDFIIVDTNDVLLICKKDMEQEIKEYVSEVKRNKGDKFL